MDAQRTMFGMFEEPAVTKECHHVIEFESMTTGPDDVERLTWTCEVCGNIRGRTTVGVEPSTYRQWLKRQGRSE